MFHIIFDGHLTTVSPLATAPPGHGGDAKRPSDMPRMRTADGDVPYFPGSGLRGKLRRVGLDVVRRALTRDNDGQSPFTIDDIYLNAIGGVKGAGDEDKIDITRNMTRRAANPLVSLFGAGSPWMEARLFTGHAIPAQPVELMTVSGVRKDPLAGDGALSVLSPDEVERWLGQAQANSTRSRLKADLRKAQTAQRKATGDEKATQDAEIARLEAAIDKINEDSYASVSVQLPLSGYRAIPAGVAMAQRCTLLNVDITEFALFIAILKRFALHPVLGAHVAHGCGLVAAEWTVKARHMDDEGFAVAGTVRIDNETCVIDPAAGHTLLSEAESAWTALVAGLEAYDFSAAAM